MKPLAEQIYTEAQRLPDDLARQVYDFIRFIEISHGIKPCREEPATAEWQSFFKRHCRSVEDVKPLNRDEIYVDRLR